MTFVPVDTSTGRETLLASMRHEQGLVEAKLSRQELKDFRGRLASVLAAVLMGSPRADAPHETCVLVDQFFRRAVLHPANRSSRDEHAKWLLLADYLVLVATDIREYFAALP